MGGTVLRFGCRVVLAGGILAGIAGPLRAEVVPGAPPEYGPPQSEAQAIHDYLCMQRQIAALRDDMTAKLQALAAVRRRLAALDEELASRRSEVEVNNPESVARYKALLERRDALAQHSLQPAAIAARDAVQRYNALVRLYDERYANRPYDSVLVAQIRANLSCSPGR